jgi:uncharacterized membrane protein YdjX (TVP38/TMEM64 family)
MKRSSEKRNLLHRIILILTIIVLITLAVYSIISGRQYFTRRNVRVLQTDIKSYGPLSPLILFFLVIISTLIPPLPIPIPLIEISAGWLFGFWPGIILTWISQICASLSAYGVSQYFGRGFLKKILNVQFLDFYRSFIKKKGALAILIIRATMACPFNVSFLAGLSSMDFLKFTQATAIGVIPETILFVWIGTLLQHSRIRLWYILILLVILGILPILTTAIVKLFQNKRKSG